MASVGGLNILPKKRWHVRTKDNIARVKRDEAKAVEEERDRKERAALAEQESRTALLRKKAAERNPDLTRATSASGAPQPGSVEENLLDESGHINFFADIERQHRTFGSNKEHEKEKKEEQESYERQIGLLKYLGEGSFEATKTKPWYEKQPAQRSVKNNAGEKESSKEDLSASCSGSIPKRQVNFHDPASLFHKPPIYTPKSLKVESESSLKKEDANVASAPVEQKRKEKSKKRKHNKDKKRSRRHKSKKRRRNSSTNSSSGDEESEEKVDGFEKNTAVDRSNLERLRAERLRREAVERSKTETLLRKLRGEPDCSNATKTDKRTAPEPIRQKYNSQFNPEICRQNYQ